MCPPFLLLSFFHLFPLVLLIPASCQTTLNPNSVRFDLFHRHHRDLKERISTPNTHHERMQELARNDHRRHRWISMKLGRNTRRRATEVDNPNEAFQMPMASGADRHNGVYFVIFNIGTPSQRFLVVADTGSDLAWINCRYRCRNCKRDKALLKRRIFRADDSKTFRPITCSSEMCGNMEESLRSMCTAPTKPCYYNYGYMEGTNSIGFYANESSTLYLVGGGRRKIKGFLIGCSTAFTGSTYRMVDGILGLGRGGHSFSDISLRHFDGKFSYCLVDHLSASEVKNYLIFGPAPASDSSMTYATLVANELNVPLYGVQVTGISVGGVMLDIPPMVWNLESRGRTILDSGTSLTMLPTPAYRPVVGALMDSLKGFQRAQDEDLEFCFYVDKGFKEDSMPKLVWHFADSVKFEPPVKSYIIIGNFHNTNCLGFMEIPWPGVSIIGNIMQQEHLWEFDYNTGRVGFRPTTCVSD